MALLTTQRVTIDGLVPTLAAATATTGDTFKCGGDSVVIVKNGSGAPVNATFVVPGTTETGEANPNNVVAVAAGAERLFPADDVYKDRATGVGTVICSAVTDVTVGVVSV